MTAQASPKSRLPMRVVAFLFTFALTLVGLSIPLLGIWAGSSLAAFAGGSVWVAILAGLLAFPTLPLVWEAVARRRRANKTARPALLKTWDRMVLRTLAVNIVFLGVVLTFGPQTLFTALATRGDWMLDGREGDASEALRGGLLRTADGLEWLYDFFDEDNEFADLVDDRGAGATPSIPPPRPPEPTPSGDAERGSETETETPETETPETPEVEAETDAPSSRRWPTRATPHPALATMPEAERSDLRRAAQWLDAQDSDPFGRVKLIHDFIAARVAYDGPSYLAGEYPPQDAETVFRTRLSVCAGYANLFHAMAQEVGMRSLVVVGDTRKRDGEISGEGHAWNAVEIEDGWYLVDVTWDAGHLDGSRFERNYRTDYLFTPPEIFRADHLPDDPDWQLHETPIGRGEFARQPMMRPGFHRHGFRLLSPTRSHITVDRVARVRIDNPLGHYVSGSFEPEGGGPTGRCVADGRAELLLACELPTSGSYRITVFANEQQYGTFQGVGGLVAVAR